MLFADRAGNIGHILAVTSRYATPSRKDDLVLDASDPATHWKGFAGVMDLPFILNPKQGVLASANDRPSGTDLPIGFTFGSDDRIRRLYDLLGAREKLTFDDLAALQTDTRAPDAAGLSSALAARDSNGSTERRGGATWRAGCATGTATTRRRRRARSPSSASCTTSCSGSTAASGRPTCRSSTASGAT